MKSKLVVLALPVAAALTYAPTTQAASFLGRHSDPVIQANGSADFAKVVQVGDVLTCDPGAVSVSGNWSTRYEWLSTAGGSIPAADAHDGNNQYTVRADDRNVILGCIVQIIDEDTDLVINETSLSGCTPSVAPYEVSVAAPSVELGTPEITNETNPGTNRFGRGDVLACNAGDWDGNQGTEFAYSWYDASGNEIQGRSTDNTYVVPLDAENFTVGGCRIFVAEIGNVNSTYAEYNLPILAPRVSRLTTTLHDNKNIRYQINDSQNTDIGHAVLKGDTMTCAPGLFFETDSLSPGTFEYSWDGGFTFSPIALSPVVDELTLNRCQVQLTDAELGSPWASSVSQTPDYRAFFVSPPFVKFADAETKSLEFGDTVTCTPSLSYGVVDPAKVALVEYQWQDQGIWTPNPDRVIVESDLLVGQLACSLRLTLADGQVIQSNDPSGTPDGSGYYLFVLDFRTTTVENPTISGLAVIGNELTCTTTTPVEDTVFTRYRYYWSDRSGDLTQLSTANTYTVESLDGYIRCHVVAETVDTNGTPDDETDDSITNTSVVNSVETHIEKPSKDEPNAVIGKPEVGQTLTCELSNWNTPLGASTVVWKDAAGNTLATGNALSITQAMQGLRVRCEETLDDGVNILGTAKSALSSPIEAMAVNPHITVGATTNTGGDSIAGQKLVCTIGVNTDQLSNLSITYKWLVDGVAVSQGPELILTEQMVGKKVLCEINLVSDQLTLALKTPEMVVRTAVQPDPQAPVNPQVPAVGLNDCAPTNDILIGTAGPDIICGGPGRDLILGGAGNDKIYGSAGDDTIYGGTGNDLIYGATGNDIIYGQDGDDKVYGEDGNDTIYTGRGTNSISGGSGNDRINGASGSDRVLGGSGNDWIATAGGNDIVQGQEGIDLIVLGDGNDKASGGVGADTIFGENGNDLISGNDGSDKLHGGNGNDRLFGNEGFDALYGGPGNDRLSGGSGSDVIYGNSGTDVLVDEKLIN